MVAGKLLRAGRGRKGEEQEKGIGKRGNGQGRRSGKGNRKLETGKPS
jgi:hypothetical protein